MFALYHVLQSQNVDVEIINYIPNHVIHKRTRKKGLRDVAVAAVSAFVVKSSKSAFRDFEEQIIKYPQKPITTTAELQVLAKRYDRIIVGSDQVWNPTVTGNDLNYYLAFSDEDKQKAAYAPSFGISQIPEEDRDHIAELLVQFKYLSVRESQGHQIIRDLIGREVPVVLDPTMLILPEIWRKQKKQMKLPAGKYVLFYTIKPSLDLRQFAQKLADQNGLNLITIGGRLREFLDYSKHPVSGVGPREFLSLIDGAEYVVTNSFHGTAFSIILQKNFYVEYSSDTNSRLMNIVDTFKLYDAVVDCDTLDKPHVQIDYDKVARILDVERKKSLEYLNGIVIGENE